MQRYNRTNFTSSGFAVRLIAAMQGAIHDGYAHYVENRQGKRWLRVNVVSEGDNGYTFQFLANNGQEVGHLILSALFVWGDDLERQFSALMSELYTRTEHPLVTARRRDLAPAEEVKPQPKKNRWKSALKVAGEYLTAIAIGAVAGHSYVAFAGGHL
ncbi:hypothetical protein 10P302A_gene0007 [Pseudomonas phage 10P302A]|uniref:Uncharacterized protein n=1 Tax=Pseudomonas phage 10P302A TaxID=3038233 RepID=A0AAF0K2B3_9CAUD|nr:hypothetical protein 10P302A_gene0007 [Pseudomonas phage 10P302A]